MPRIFPEAPDLAISPDGAWAAALFGSSLRLYDLTAAPHAAPPAGSTDGIDEAQPEPASPVGMSEPFAAIDRPPGSGRIFFLDNERLLHVFIEPSAGDEPGLIAADLLGIPSLNPLGAMARVAGAQRIVGIGPAGAVVAPNGPGADILHVKNGELVLQRTFMRGEVLSAIAAPDRRFLLEQRGGFDLWDPATRGALSRLVLQTRQQSLQIGYVANGRMLFALAAGPPVHVEIFRASDGRRFLETDQPGRGLAADVAPHRLVIAVEERGGQVFLDLDLLNGALARAPLPPDAGKLLSFAVRPALGQPEIVALAEDGGSAVLRLPLARLQSGAPAGESTEQAGTSSSARDRRPPLRTPGPATEQPGGLPPRPGRARPQRPELRPEGRPENRFLRRPQLAPGDGPSRFAPQLSAGSLLTDEAQEDEAPPEAATAPVQSITLGDSGEKGRSERSESSRQRRQRETLARAYDPAASPAAWQWELMRWAQLALQGGDDTGTQLPPEGGPIHKLAMRLRLTPVAQKLLALLYAGEHLLGARPKGMRLLDLVACLSGLYEEPTLVAELLPSGPLRMMGLISMGSDGRLRLSREAAAMLLEVPCPELLPPAGGQRELLPPGLYSHPGPYTRVATLLTRQPVLRVDALTEPKLLPALERALAQALVYDAVVILDGVAGLAYPAFSSSALLPSLRPLLTGLRVPVILCAMPDAIPAVALSARPLPPGMVITSNLATAPLLPSAPLPVGTSWRSPLLPVSAAFHEGNTGSGRLELQVPGDRRAAVVIGPNASPDAYSVGAYLAARDGAVMMVDVELTSVRSLVLSMLLRQLPLTVTAVPPGGPGTPWPAALVPFAQ